jgi:predicted DNA-binding transcriptional regulator AlpA
MRTFSTRQVAKQLGIAHVTLMKHISDKKIPAPKSVTSGGMTIHLWTEAEIEHVRQLLPKIANGRKTRYKKQSAKTKKKTQAGVPAPHKKK